MTELTEKQLECVHHLSDRQSVLMYGPGLGKSFLINYLHTNDKVSDLNMIIDYASMNKLLKSQLENSHIKLFIENLQLDNYTITHIFEFCNNVDEQILKFLNNLKYSPSRLTYIIDVSCAELSNDFCKKLQDEYEIIPVKF